MSFEAKEVRTIEVIVKMDEVEPLHNPPYHPHVIHPEMAQYHAERLAERLIGNPDVMTYLYSHLEIEELQVYEVRGEDRLLLLEAAVPDREERIKKFKEAAWLYAEKRMKEESGEESKEQKNPDWYELHIEQEVREPVRLLRNIGVNTTSSCGHHKWIECETYDQSEEIATVSNVLMENGISNFRIESVHVHNEKTAWTRCMTIKFPDAEGNYTPQMV